MAPRLIIPAPEHFTGRVTYRGTGIFAKIKARFEEFNLNNTAKESRFGSFWNAVPLTFSSVLFHQLMLHKMKVDAQEELRMRFYVGRKEVRFGVLEFALITGLDFSSGPTEEEKAAQVARSGSDRLINKYFNRSDSVKTEALQLQFTNCQNPEDLYKLGLCLFVESVLLGREANALITPHIIRYVEDLEFFFRIPWGKHSFARLMHSLQKDMLKQKANYEKKLSSDVQHECKYTAYGFAPAVQYWAYEAILEVGKRYGTNHGIRFPEMLSRTSKGDIGKKDSCTETRVPYTQERDTQATGSEPQPSAPSSSGVRGAEYTDLVARLDRIEGDTQGLYAAHVELKKAYETSHVELKGGQNVIMEQLRDILAMLNRPPTTASAPEAPADPSTPPPAASPPVEEDEVFPDDYDPYEGAPATPIEAQPLIHVHDTESQGEILSIEAQPAVVKSRKRKRKPPVWFGDYTEMKRRHRPSSTFDPLEPPDEKLLTTFRKWCVGLIPNHRLRDLRSGDYGPGFFWIMLTPKEWLTDDHIDAAMHMLRRRRTDYPLTFPQKGIILSTFVTAMISSAWTSHKGPRKNFKWEEYILDYCTGFHKSQVFERWRGNEFIYFVLHLPTARHWVTVEVDIELWKINVYDCDSSNGKYPILTPEELKQEDDVGIVTPAMQKVLDAARAFERERNGNEFRFMQLEREFAKTGEWPAPPPGFPEGCRRCKSGIFNL
ncbi:uncharacterized protein LOC115723646 [Cannabis sativa]|uniref:uncharacterized protein LOC115723646 n=1 Tax=Cannabis sativa TaxID=3483 RepID=UPI0029C9F55B|nr:uncharacterized protein LOC115723646 [Cannabis sativa]